MHDFEDQISEGRWGPSLTVDTDWTAHHAAIVREYGIRELVVHGRRFPGGDLSILCEFKHSLSALTLFSSKELVKPIECLSELKSLDIGTYEQQPPLDFNSFPKLTECLIDWSPVVRGFAMARTLERLAISDAPEFTIKDVSTLTNLKDLSIINCKAESLAALSSLRQLQRMRLTRLSRLRDNRFLADLPCLEELWVQRSSGFSSLESLSYLSSLKKLIIEDTGPFETLQPLQNLKSIEWLAFSGPNARPVDGIYTYVEDLPDLQHYMRT